MIVTAPASQGFHIIAVNNQQGTPYSTKLTAFCTLGIDNSSLLWMLNALITHFMGFEAGDVAVGSCYRGTIRLPIWQERRGIIVLHVVDLGVRLDDLGRTPGMIDQANAPPSRHQSKSAHALIFQILNS